MYCPICDGPGILLGTLGKLTHFRCRDCGMDFNMDTEEFEEMCNAEDY